jgi:ABC-type bacteriocin/lantibiotic exporter with double-glycine peptidase domain
MNDLLNYISDLYFAKQIKNYYLLFANKIISALGNKKTNFLNKIDKKWLEKIDLCIHGISSFCVNTINKFITHTIFAIICICITASIQIYLIIFAIAILLVEFICFLFLYRKKAEIFLPTMMNDNNKNDLYKQITYFLKHEIYENKKN